MHRFESHKNSSTSLGSVISLLIILIFISGNVYSLQWLNPFFQQCSGVSSKMSGSIDDIYIESWIPDGFSCEDVLYTEKVKWDGERINIVSNENICKKIRNLEVKWNRTCIDVLCGGLPENSMHNLMKHSDSSVEEWINACQYCGNNSIVFRDLVRRRECKANNEIVQQAITNFPTSMLFCGTFEYGIPFLFNNSKSKTSELSKNEFSYYCTCLSNGYYQPKCLPYNSDKIIHIAIRALLESIIVGEFFIGLFIVFIPKLVHSIRTKSFFHMLTISYTMLKLLIEAIFYMFAVVLDPEDGIALIVPTIIDCLNIILLLALFSWLGGWMRKVLVFFNKKNLIYSLLIYGIPFLMSFFGVAVPITMLLVLPKERVLTKVYFLNGFSLALLVFVIFGVIIGRALKKVSDVSIWKSQFAKYLVFITLVYIAFCISIALSLGISNESALKQTLDILSSLILLLVTASLLNIEFEMDELKSCYSCCFKSKQNFSSNHSPLLLHHHPEQSSTNYYSEVIGN
ncbi:predicted protein [Naegleria gruberi]|uniref:Predicted protein n=1 Tax=Naegleria gruberi TaxID=5762 RepID=D2W500_NAEGR|nr:uncharacterized protein NAEGRDRAFT_76488 [Naegleria gruberi]EFC35851.1 predicted protein [Naegleria gruberi]|eukprot:XP_002668595.1 predicted protein [Naegleria gruberi strain NEG-M]